MAEVVYYPRLGDKVSTVSTKKMNELFYKIIQKFILLKMSVAYEKICEFTSALSSPAEIDGALYMVA